MRLLLETFNVFISGSPLSLIHTVYDDVPNLSVCTSFSIIMCRRFLLWLKVFIGDIFSGNKVDDIAVTTAYLEVKPFLFVIQHLLLNIDMSLSISFSYSEIRNHMYKPVSLSNSSSSGSVSFSSSCILRLFTAYLIASIQ